ncbi:MAG: DUF2854 domain-containing protein [Desertifilum sp.]|nr:DUF2854 domain-containing protein [Desertifilum sp.]NES95834.1 DUF2854 domain-containing protein [Desertifilum sp. SIO1I2]
MLRKVSLGNLLLIVGTPLALGGLIAYFTNNPTLNLAGFFYGIPILLGGLALKAAELEPIAFTQPTSEAVLALREQQATEIQNQLRQDVTRFRYGQSAHLDDALERLGLSPTDEERPVLTGIRETETQGNYTLILEFDSPFFSVEDWQQKQEKITKFFGPGIQSEITQPESDRIELALMTAPNP